MMGVLIAAGLTFSPCNQLAYDTAYRNIIQEAINSNLTVSDLNLRNDRIEALRGICNGQVSSYEVGVEYSSPTILEPTGRTEPTELNEHYVDSPSR